MRLAASVVIAVLLLPVAGSAEPTATFQVTVVQGVDVEAPADGRINAAVKSQLAKLRFRSYKVLSQTQMQVRQGSSADVSTPAGKVSLAYQGTEANGALKVKADVHGKSSTTGTMKPEGVLVVNASDDVFVPIQLVRAK